ncbi:putative sporulation protein YyaC [Desulfohalotomaculum tongense]|uniref:spore protease YyaC n=1 Tax=Desulforadius tongensis TaxID=1216062 RepID=UPI00195887E5|nr:spore protease YyaC [Desulforadius tongensis]MBM7855806.1 putative sporulation protein YyaC [Desulforadius tongensis]
MAIINQLEQHTAVPKTRINCSDPLAVKKFSWDLTYKLLKCGLKPGRPVVLVCIGTDRSTGDCLGPLVGSKLSEIGQDFFEVYGTLENPVHGGNLEEKLDEINKCYHNPLIIAVDASLGQLDNVGCVNIATGALKPGAGVHKKLPAVGDIHITGVVNVGGFMEYMVLQNTRLNLVMQLANLISDGLLATIVEYKQTKAQGM